MTEQNNKDLSDQPASWFLNRGLFSDHFLKPGDAVYYDSTQPHLVKSATKTKARILAVLYTGAK